MEQNNQPAASPVPQTPPPKDQQAGKNIGMAVVAYILFFIPLFTDSKNHPFVKYHVHQGFLIFLACVATMIIGWIPFIGMFDWVLSIAVLILFVIGIMNALGGQEKPLPIIGQYADKFKF